MRFFEFADAEAQLGLLRTIIDNTWVAIAQQAEQQKLEKSKKKTHKSPTKSRQLKPIARPLLPKNGNFKNTQNHDLANQKQPPIVPSPEQNLSAYRGYMQPPQNPYFQQKTLEPITSNPTK